MLMRFQRLEFDLQESRNDSRLDDPAMDRRVRLSVVRIGRIALRLRCVVALPTTALRR